MITSSKKENNDVFSEVTGWGAQKMLVSVHISANVHHQNDAFLSFRYNLISVHHTVNNFSFSVKINVLYA